MATLTTSYQCLGQAYIGTSGGSLYVRVYAKYSQQDITNNRTLVQYQARAYYENGNYIRDDAGNGSVNGTSSGTATGSCTRPTTGETTIATTEAWVYHNADGTKSISCSAKLNFPNWGWSNTANGSASLPTIPRASSISCPGGNIGSSTKISISRASSSFTHTISYSFGSLSGTIATKTSSTSIDWTIPTSFYAQIPNSNTGTITLTCQTYSGSTLIGTKTATCTANVTDSNPVFPSLPIIYEDTNSEIALITQNRQQIVRNLSFLTVSFLAAEGQNGATITKYKVTFNGTIRNLTESGTIEYGTVNLSSNETITIEAIDSRGNSAKTSEEIIILDWVQPTATFSVGRINNYEDETKITPNCVISSVNEKNYIRSITCYYKKVQDSQYTNQINLTNYAESTLYIDKKYTWDFKVVIADRFGSTTYYFQIAKGMPLFYRDVKRLSVGVNGFPTKDNQLYNNGEFYNEGDFFIGGVQLQPNASETISGGIKIRLDAAILYITTDGSDP